MNDTVFRTKSEPSQTKPNLKPSKTAQPISSDKEVMPPFTSYYQQKGQPYTVDHFDLGEYWNDPDGGFEEEVGQIEDYLRQKIERGDIADNVEAVKNEFKQMLKINNLKNEQRTVVKIGTLAAYTKFLAKADGIQKLYRKYGH